MSPGHSRLAERYFQKLLHETPSADAIERLSACWRPRITNGPQLGLSIPEYRVQLVLTYTSLIGDGGHRQYFLKQGLGGVDALKSALMKMGLSELAALLSTAASLLPDLHKDAGQAALAEAISNADEALTARWAALDDRASAHFADCADKLLAYMRANEPEILTAERA